MIKEQNEQDSMRFKEDENYNLKKVIIINI